MTQAAKNIGVSVRARLLHLAEKRGERSGLAPPPNTRDIDLLGFGAPSEGLYDVRMGGAYEIKDGINKYAAAPTHR